jgi:tRNA G18 (ribose-2'-O)-methylase SpoU
VHGRELQPIQVSDAADDRLADYRALKAERVRDAERAARDDGVFIAEGEFVVGQLLQSRFATRSLLCTPARFERIRDMLAAAPGEFPVYVAPQAMMEALAGFQFHRGVLAAGVRAAPQTAHQVIADARTLVVLEDISNHDNVGGIFRSIGALAPRAGVLLNPRCCDPLYRKAVRVSMGQALRVPYAVAQDWPGGLDLARRAGFRVLALTPRESATDIGDLGPGRYALMVGAEGPGLTAEAFAAADEHVRIPIQGRADSLNVVVALSIALHRLAAGDPNARSAPDA